MNYQVTELLTQKHVNDLVAIGRAYMDISEVDLPYNVEDVHRTANFVLSDIDRSAMNIFLIYKGEEVIGFAVGSINKYHFNDLHYSSLDIIFVAPSYRGTRAFLLLIKHFEEWSRLNSCVEIWMGTNGTTGSKSLTNTLPRIGYPEAGTYHRKRTI